MTTWGGFAAAEPELAAFVEPRLRAAPSYLATVRQSGAPQLHPVTPIFTTDGLYLFMEPTSPKGDDLRERGRFALHNGVPDNAGTGGEASVSGTGHHVDDAATRATVAAAATSDPADRYVLFELRPTEVRCKGYGDVALPERQRWSADAPSTASRPSGHVVGSAK
ncbi:MAG TPA: pyridoxamine 5'-phosphate oxidase family protein [Jiangellaceae bacterium]